MHHIAKIILPIIVVLLLNISHALANRVAISGSGDFYDSKLEDILVSGAAMVENSEFRTLTISGSIDFTDLKVTEIFVVSGDARGKGLETKRMVVSGSLVGENIIISGDASISGSSDISNSKMKGETKIFGGFKIHHSEFNELIIDSDSMLLADSTVHNITINNEQTKLKPQKLFLKGKTVISGDIIFKSGDGEIIADKDVVIKGKIEGAVRK